MVQCDGAIAGRSPEKRAEEKGGMGRIPLGAGLGGELDGEVSGGGGTLVCWRLLAGDASAGGGGRRGRTRRSAA